jgi:hypothetical protein
MKKTSSEKMTLPLCGFIFQVVPVGFGTFPSGGCRSFIGPIPSAALDEVFSL